MSTPTITVDHIRKARALFAGNPPGGPGYQHYRCVDGRVAMGAVGALYAAVHGLDHSAGVTTLFTTLHGDVSACGAARNLLGEEADDIDHMSASNPSGVLRVFDRLLDRYGAAADSTMGRTARMLRLLEAMESSEPVIFAYQDKDGIRSIRYARILGIEKCKGGQLIVRAADLNRQAPRTFLLDEIGQVACGHDAGSARINIENAV